VESKHQNILDLCQLQRQNEDGLVGPKHIVDHYAINM